ncbi:ABA4-like family protein [Litorimonas sp. RW-G-Af-16]|uniref:ABA4-like family protein n=1 Tax=Litorimonas sp. RW-G-Af-16 TaxID=3241168 RepID=UPI00390C61A0
MTFEMLFSLINLSVLPAWALLILAPRWSGTRALVHSMLYPLMLGLLYAVCLGLAVFGGMGAEGGGFNSIAQVRALFASDIGIITGWAHYLVFDLFVGAWEARDAKRRGFSHWLLIPCLLLTFMAGPFGLLLYVVLRKVTGKGGWALEAQAK